jgi:predicted enzyme related to lactoylglutathione lyase
MSPLVHLELHTGDLRAACETYARLCDWQAEQASTDSGSYMALDLGERVGGGVVECTTKRAMWLPYVRVREIQAAMARACELGASVLLEPREGPAGWRAVISTQAGGELAFWQPKEWAL